MPIYEFHCSKCGEDSEVLVRSTHWEGTKCPHCGSTKLSKKLSVFASSGAAGTSNECGGAACDGSGRASGGCGCCSGGHKH